MQLNHIIVSLAVTGVLYLVLQHFDDKRTRENGEPPASSGRKMALFFFTGIVVLVLLHWLGYGGDGAVFGDNMSSAHLKGTMQAAASSAVPMMAAMNSGKEAITAAMLKNIKADVTVGGVPF